MAFEVGTAFDLTGRTVLVTGGSRGLGRAMVMGFARAGADVVIASRDAATTYAHWTWDFYRHSLGKAADISRRT